MSEAKPPDVIVPPPPVEGAEAVDALTTGETQRKPKEPIFEIARVGSMPFTAHGHHYSGCKILYFESMSSNGKLLTAIEQANEYFVGHQNVMCVDWKADMGSLTLIVTNVLTDEEMEVLNLRGKIISEMVKEEQEKKAKALEEAEERVHADEIKLRELAKHGEHCLKNHGSVVKTMREKGKKGK